MKKYLVEFTHINGTTEVIEFSTDRLEWTIQQYYRNRAIATHQILEEKSSASKQMLFG